VCGGGSGVIRARARGGRGIIAERTSRGAYMRTESVMGGKEEDRETEALG
jgi:hypothetical protein